MIRKKSKAGFILSSIFIFCLGFTAAGNAWAAGADGGYTAQASAGLAVMLPKQSKSFTAESDTLFDAMIIPVLLWGNGTLNVTVSKTDSSGEMIGVILKSNGATEMDYNTGITPRSITVSSRFWGWGYAVVYSALLFSQEEGPYSYSVSLSFN